jgi:hypothetical protein
VGCGLGFTPIGRVHPVTNGPPDEPAENRASDHGCRVSTKAVCQKTTRCSPAKAADDGFRARPLVRSGTGCKQEGYQDS